mmetsp:Transcript_5540/g.6803  ORF Transcript_5540/g.6803 Transcript_5540/m.6803 type:complete len:457 (-) Transcript_5540:742-2112(-)
MRRNEKVDSRLKLGPSKRISKRKLRNGLVSFMALGIFILTVRDAFETHLRLITLDDGIETFDIIDLEESEERKDRETEEESGNDLESLVTNPQKMRRLHTDKNEEMSLMETQVQQADHLHQSRSSILTRKHKLVPTTEGCKRVSPHNADEAPLRIFIYQKKGGQQLVSNLIHYLQAMTYDEIVILTNEEGDNILSDPFYEDIVSKGIHMWQCSGTLLMKGNRWSEVMNQYQKLTDFLLPIDVDELLSISSPDLKNRTLTWDRPTLLSTLDSLPSSGGKPYKTLDAKPVPIDCDKDSDGPTLDFDRKYMSRHCMVPGITRGKKGCFAKNIFEGKTFTTVDNGNHHGPKEKTPEFRSICEKGNFDQVYIQTTFVLVHYQVVDFGDWLTHLLKRAVDYQYEMNCDEPNPNWPSHHVCNLYAQGKAVNFSISEMKKTYKGMLCANKALHYDTSHINALSC